MKQDDPKGEKEALFHTVSHSPFGDCDGFGNRDRSL